MGLKALFFLGFFLATYLLISSQVAAVRELAAEASTTEVTANDKVDKTNEVGVDQYGGYPGGGYPGRGGYGGYPGGGYGGYPGRGRGGYGGRCRFGCCGGGGYYYGYRRCRCCYYAGQVPDGDWQSELGN
ncbi:glycine-rich protein-like [Henckelia pumila]|uniref:glycine-rich protein-like n=1 Tax=Henckelia pumila TaxID=405737 RepID=UPI003C6DCD00